MGESSTTPDSNSKTVLDTVTMKIVRRKGKITNFMIDTSQDYIDAQAYEMENNLQAHILDMIYYILYGNKAANVWEFDGVNNMLASHYSSHSPLSGGAVPANLKFLDSMIDKSNRRGGVRHRRAFLVSPEMLSLISSLLSNVRLNQGLQGSGLTQVDIGGGWRLNAYRDIPIIETTSMSPVEAMTATVTCAASTAPTDGAMSNGTYYVAVAPVTYDGEQAPCAIQTVVLNAGTSVQGIKIDLSAPHYTVLNGVNTASAMSYRIYAGTVNAYASLTLKKEVSAFTYGSDGTPNGDNGITASIYLLSMTHDASVTTAKASDIPLVASSGIYPENIFLWDLDPIQGLGKLPFTNQAGDRFEGLVVTKPLAETDDFIQFLIKSYAALCPSYEATSVWLRNVRAA